MSEKNWYKAWFDSPYYYKLYSTRDDKEASAFIDKLIQYLNPLPESRMLDVGCGRGRHSRRLAEKGFYVTGIDISPASIAYARQFTPPSLTGEPEKLEFYQHDMQLPFRVNYYEYVFNFFTSFGYFNTRREHEDTIRTLAKSLKEKGILVIDYLNTHYTETRLIREEEKNVEGTLYQIHRWQDDNFFYKKIIVQDALLSYPLEFTEQVAKFSLGDFTDMLSYCRLQVQEVFGDYNLGSYHLYNKPRLIIVAKK